jgi:hypothetical protein
VGFIFTIHFFNSHLRPHKFPMDLVMFTGVVEEGEYRRERSRETARLEVSGELERRVAPPPNAAFVRRARIAGTVAIAVGLGLFTMIMVGVLS